MAYRQFFPPEKGYGTRYAPGETNADGLPCFYQLPGDAAALCPAGEAIPTQEMCKDAVTYLGAYAGAVPHWEGTTVAPAAPDPLSAESAIALTVTS